MNSLLSAIYVMGPLGSLRALNFILVEISLVSTFLTHHLGYMTIFLSDFFLLLSEYLLDCIQAG